MKTMSEMETVVMSQEEQNIRKIIKKVVSQNNAGSGGEMAIYNAIFALVETGITTAACGSLGLGWQRDLKAVLNDEDSLNRVARLLWWGEE
tara:strand:+ start:110 stop:382 length:273 start_codon:yes stop_codon:yes gene_type:complete